MVIVLWLMRSCLRMCNSNEKSLLSFDCVKVSQIESPPLTVSTDWITTNNIVILSVSSGDQNISQHKFRVNAKLIRLKNVEINVYCRKKRGELSQRHSES